MFNFVKYPRWRRQKVLLRIVVALVFILACFGLLAYRLWVLQVERYHGLSARAERNRISLVPIAPRRGDIVDRNGLLLARSYRDYTLEVVPAQVANIDDMLERLTQYVPLSALDKRRFRRRLLNAHKYSSVVLRHKLSDDEAGIFAVNAYQFPGVSLKARWVREYPYGESAAHLLGYVGRISEYDQKQLEAQERLGNYRGTDVIGKKGVEASYEAQLHGKTGWETVEVSASGRPMRVLSRTDPVPGDTLRLSIDMGLQQMVESLFAQGNQRGALVAIEPATGQVLAYVSAPSFDPNLFIDGIDEANWRRLSDSPDFPLLDRPISGTFPIGSTYKPFVGLAALEMGIRRADEKIPDPGYFEYGNQRFRNAGRAVYGPTDMHKAIAVSSDTYFFSLGPLMGVDRLHDFVQPFGFGKQTGIDLLGEKRGILPSKAWKQRAFKDPKRQEWLSGETISVMVGQGYNALTIMQLAQATSTLAADGVYRRPHVVNWLENERLRKAEQLFTEPEYTIHLNPAHLAVVKKAMVEVNRGGTAGKVFADAHYKVAGKTGTAQVFSLKGGQYDAKRLNKRLHDHALYMGFAPVDKPAIALALIVENGGWGSAVAAPIARQVFDYWLSPTRQVVHYTPPVYEDTLADERSQDTEVPEQTFSHPDDGKLNRPQPEIWGAEGMGVAP